MRRREFISVIGSAAAAWSAVARAQQPSVPVVGYLGSGSRESAAFRLIPFRQGLRGAETVGICRITAVIDQARRKIDLCRPVASSFIDAHQLKLSRRER
jgi:hypothetical protein